MADPRLPTSPSSHPDDELLIAYLSDTLRDADRADVETHLRTCDDCVQGVAMMRHLLSKSDQMPTPIPEALRQRAVEAVDESSRRQTLTIPVSESAGWLPSMLEWLFAVLRPRLLVPLAMTALAALVIVNRQAWFNPAAEHQRTRALELHETLYVTSSEATVWSRSGGNASEGNTVVGTVRRDQPVDVIGREDDWYRVRLSNHQEGWVERSAFE